MADDVDTRVTGPSSDPPSGIPTIPHPSSPSAVPSAATDLPTVDPSHYAVESELARGGMGRILAARDLRLDRPVAIKEVLHRDDAMRRRFEREARITARLQHPSIVAVYEAGRWPDGEPFYAMKRVDGRSLATVIAQTPAFDERLALLPSVIAVAEALAYAHGQRIIHRDLKPENVLVGSFGEVVVIDWGLAKDLAGGGDPDAVSVASVPPATSESAALTVAGSVCGTPQNMPPEQALGLPVDERADVFAVGTILYHLLAGAPAYEAAGAREMLLRLLAGPPPPLAGRAPGVPAELCAIVDKAMAREPRDRYPTARQLAEALRAFHTRQFVRAEHLERERDRAERALALAVARADDLTLVQARAALDVDPLLAIAWLKGLSPGFGRWGAARTIAADAKARGIPRLLSGHTEAVWHVAFSPDGEQLASASWDGAVRLWSVASGEARVLDAPGDKLLHVELSADGASVAAVGFSGCLRVWDQPDGSHRALPGAGRSLAQLALSRDGRWAASRGGSPELPLWDLAAGRVDVLRSGATPVWVAFSPTSDLLAAVHEDGEVCVWSVETRARTSVGRHEAAAEHVVFSPLGDRLATCGHDGVVRVFRFEGEAWQPEWTLAGHGARIRRVAISPNGDSLASAGLDGTVRLWSLATGEGTVIARHRGPAIRVAFSPDGLLVASMGVDGGVVLSDPLCDRERRSGGGAGYGNLAFSPGGDLLAFPGVDHGIRLLAIPSDEPRVTAAHCGAVVAVGTVPGSRRLLSSGSDGTIVLWSPADGDKACYAVGGSVAQGQSEDGGHSVLLACLDGAVRRLDLRTGAVQTLLASGLSATFGLLSLCGTRAVFGAPERLLLADVTTGRWQDLSVDGESVAAGALSPDLALAVGTDRSLWLWEAGTAVGERVRADGGPYQPVFSSDGRWLVVLTLSSVTVLRAGTWKPLLDLPPATTFVTFSPGGRRLAAACGDRTVAVWDLEPVPVCATTLRCETPVQTMALSMDGRRLVTSSGSLRLWDVASAEYRILAAYGPRVTCVAFTPEGRGVIAGGADGSLRFWRDDLPDEPEELRSWLDAATPAVVGPDGRLRMPGAADAV